MPENIHDPSCDIEERELTEDEIEEAMEDLAAEVADQGGKWTVTQRQRYNHLQHGN